jgi:hypothetical protein
MNTGRFRRAAMGVQCRAVWRTAIWSQTPLRCCHTDTVLTHTHTQRRRCGGHCCLHRRRSRSSVADRRRWTRRWPTSSRGEHRAHSTTQPAAVASQTLASHHCHVTSIECNITDRAAQRHLTSVIHPSLFNHSCLRSHASTRRRHMHLAFAALVDMPPAVALLRARHTPHAALRVAEGTNMGGLTAGGHGPASTKPTRPGRGRARIIAKRP